MNGKNVIFISRRIPADNENPILVIKVNIKKNFSVDLQNLSNEMRLMDNPKNALSGRWPKGK